MQLGAVRIVNVRTLKSVPTANAWTPAWPTTPVPATPSATPPTTRQPAAAPLASRATPMSSVSGWNAELTRTAQRTPHVSRQGVSTRACTRTPAPLQLPAASRTTTPSACARPAGWAIHWCPVHPRKRLLAQNLTQSAMWMETVRTTQPV